MSVEERKPCLIKAEEVAARADRSSHPFNPNSDVIGTHLASLTGLQRTGVSIVRVPPGKESFVYHSHYLEEEWLYILSGRGIAEIDGKEHEVGPGDFMGFPTPSVAHHLRNPFDKDLLYLMGGEHREVEIADYPRLGKRLVRRGMDIEIYGLSDGKPFEPPATE